MSEWCDNVYGQLIEDNINPTIYYDYVDEDNKAQEIKCRPDRYFWSELCDQICKYALGDTDQLPHNIFEIIDPDDTVLRVVLRFEFLAKTERSRFVSAMRLLIISLCQRALEATFDVSEDYYYRAIFLASDMYTHKYKDRDVHAIKFMVQFPNVRLSSSMFEKYRLNMISIGRRSDIYQNLQSSGVTNDLNSIIEKSDDSNIVPIYGLEYDKYTMYRDPVCKELLNHDDLFDSNENYEFDDLFYTSSHPNFNVGSDSDSCSSSKDSRTTSTKSSRRNKDLDRAMLEAYVPVYLSDRYATSGPNKVRPLELRTDVEVALSGTNKLETCEQLIKIISVSRFLESEFITELGEALYDASKGNDEGKSIWKEAILNAELEMQDDEVSLIKYLDQCDIVYPKFHKSVTTYKTLVYYAKHDNYVEFSKWHREWVDVAIEAAIDSFESYDMLAKAFAREYVLDYACTSVGSTTVWYYNQNGRWHRDDNAIHLKVRIRDDFVDRINKYIEKISAAKGRKDHNLSATREKLISKCKHNDSKRLNVVRSLVLEYHVTGLQNILNSKGNITGVKNGCIVAEEKGIYFRQTKPEDYVSMSMGARYRNFSWKSKEVRAVMDWFSKVYCNRELLEFVLKIKAGHFVAGNRRKMFVVHTGEKGNNSKSACSKLDMELYADYAKKGPMSLLEEKKSGMGGGPNPELARGENARVFIFDEAGQNTILSASLLKRVTGGDHFYARDLYSSGKDFKPTFVPHLYCNLKPKSSEWDEATKARYFNIPYDSVFTDDAPEDINEQYAQRRFKKDVNFEDKIPDMVDAFLWILIEYYKKLVVEGIEVPSSVAQANETYWNRQDPYLCFTSDCIRLMVDREGNSDESCTVSKNELYLAYVQWCERNGMRRKPAPLMEFTDEMARRWKFGPRGSKWYGVSIIDEEKDDADLGIAPVSINTRQDEEGEFDHEFYRDGVEIVEPPAVQREAKKVGDIVRYTNVEGAPVGRKNRKRKEAF